MFKRALLRGVTAGSVAGLGYGLYVAVVATPLIGYAETFESGGEATVVPELVVTLGSVFGGVLYGILLGAGVFGVGLYLLEPAIPGRQRTKRIILATGGFLIVSGVPWLVLPPAPPGIEQSLPTDVRLGWYVASMAVGILACSLAVSTYNRFVSGLGRPAAVVSAIAWAVPVAGLVLVAPANQISGSVPESVALLFTVVTVAGQVGLWALLAAAHHWLSTRNGSEWPPSEPSTSIG